MGRGRDSAGLAVAVVLLATIVAFWHVSVPAGALLAAYLFWVSFATYLNAAIWWAGRDREVAA